MRQRQDVGPLSLGPRQEGLQLALGRGERLGHQCTRRPPVEYAGLDWFHVAGERRSTESGEKKAGLLNNVDLDLEQDAVISSVRTAQEARSGGLNGIYNRFVQTLADEKLDLAGLARAAARAAGSWSIPVSLDDAETVGMDGSLTWARCPHQVCDISHLGPNNVVPHMNEIYRPFSKNDRPKYCSRTLCSNNEAVTKAFFEQAHLWDFEPPFRHCRDNARLPPKPGWSLSLNNPSLKVDEGKKPEVKEQAST